MHIQAYGCLPGLLNRNVLGSITHAFWILGTTDKGKVLDYRTRLRYAASIVVSLIAHELWVRHGVFTQSGVLKNMICDVAEFQGVAA